MTCDKYKIYETGEMDKNDFMLHLKTCPDCQNISRQDELLMQTAKNLDKDIVAPDLWPAIQDTLNKESFRPEFKIIQFISRHKFLILRVAAVLFVAILSGLYLLFQPKQETIDQSGILDRAALEFVIEKEQDYMNAIEQLEQTASKHLVSIDENLIDLYKNKLRVIDQQIVRCKEALEQNPANTHIRRYLFAVLQDKKQTLEEILTYPI